MFYFLRYPAAVEHPPPFFLQKGLQHPSRVYGSIELATILIIPKRHQFRETARLVYIAPLRQQLTYTDKCYGKRRGRLLLKDSVSLGGYVVLVIKPAPLVTASNTSISPASHAMAF